MAKMHSRARGKSRSRPSFKASKPSWVQMSSKEVELLIVKFLKEGKSKAQIGTILRDVYGIPNIRVITEKRLGEISKEKNLSGDIPEDLLSLIRRLVNTRKHLIANHKDMFSLRGVHLTESKIKRLVKYYKREGALPLNWKFTAETAELLAK